MKHTRLIYALFVTLMTLLLIEAGLRIIDPWGVWVGSADARELGSHMMDDPARRYVMEPGRVKLSHTVVTILPDGSRAVPDTNLDASFTLVFVGDSITFGMSVSDDETWVNLVAREFPDVHVINASLPGYNSHQVRAVWNDYPQADAIVYLVVENDPEPDQSFKYNWGGWALTKYLGYTLTQRSDVAAANTSDWSRFYGDLDAIYSDPRVTLVAFDWVFGQALAKQYSIQFVQPYTHKTSLYDGHANPEGNREIAQEMIPIVREIVEHTE